MRAHLRQSVRPLPAAARAKPAAAAAAEAAAVLDGRVVRHPTLQPEAVGLVVCDAAEQLIARGVGVGAVALLLELLDLSGLRGHSGVKTQRALGSTQEPLERNFEPKQANLKQS